MGLFKIEIIGTGSSGNAYILHFENGKKYQFDAGLRNEKTKDIEKVFISHAHKDHIKYVNEFNPDKVILPTKEPREIDNWESFFVPHAELNNGYVLREDGEEIVYITDCGKWYDINKQFPNATYLMVECNWDYFRVNSGIIQKSSYSDYVFSEAGHLSNLDCLNLIASLQIPPTCKIILIHKSEQHSCKDTFKMFDSLPNKLMVAEGKQTIMCKSWKIF